MGHLTRDVRFAVRTMLRTPTFTLVAVTTLALGIGASTAIFTVVDGLLLRDLPYDEPGQLVTVWLDMTERDGPLREWFTAEDLIDYRAEPGLFEEMAAWGGWGPTLTELGDPEVLTAAVVTEGMFERVLRVRPFLGRDFLAEEDRPGAPGSVILSHAFWRDRMAADPTVLGRSVVLNEVPYSVVGVMPEGFQPPFVPAADLWGPAQLDPATCGRGCYTVRAIARLVPGAPLNVARERASALAARLAETYPGTNGRVGAALFGLKEDLVRPAAQALWVLLGAVGFVLLIACTNVANLLLARGAARQGELGVRVALGAGRGPVLRQLLTESLVLAGVGGLLGLLLATWGTQLLVTMAPVAVPGLDSVRVDGRILAFTAALSLGTGVLFGLVPALRLSRTDLYSTVRGSSGGSTRGARLRDGLVVAQVAMAMVLLVGAGLLIRSFQELSAAELGFEPEGVLAVNVALPASRFTDAPSRIGYYAELVDRLEALPGVATVGATNSPPLAGFDGDADFRIEGQPVPQPPEANVAWIRRITGDYFLTIGQRLLEGRAFDERDAAGSPRVVIVNQTLATRYFDYPRGNPVGQRVAFGGGGDLTWRTVVGVVEDTRHFGIRDGTRPAMYFPYTQVPTTAMTLLLSVEGDPGGLADEARAAVSALDARLAASTIAPLAELVERALANDRFVMRLLGLFAAVALALAAVGLYGVVSYGVTQRMRELGIRVALGAESNQVRRPVVAGALSLTAVGATIGGVGALLIGDTLDALLFGVGTTDPLTFATMVGVLAGVSVLASWLPARRADRTDPVSILRAE